MEEHTITAADLIQQDIDINEPIGNLKKLLEPRIQVSLDQYEICLQDIQVTAPCRPQGRLALFKIILLKLYGMHQKYYVFIIILCH
jgi:hypothetical protein